MMADGASMSPQVQDLILQRIGSTLLASSPRDWQEIRFIFDATSEISTALLEVTKTDGTVVTLQPPGHAMSLIDDLRDGMYVPDKGAWFTARYIVSRPGNYRVQYDYDNEPSFDFPLDPQTFVNDLEQYPRSEENIPDWLRSKLSEARQ